MDVLVLGMFSVIRCIFVLINMYYFVFVSIFFIIKLGDDF